MKSRTICYKFPTDILFMNIMRAKHRKGEQCEHTDSGQGIFDNIMKHRKSEQCEHTDSDQGNDFLLDL